MEIDELGSPPQLTSFIDREVRWTQNNGQNDTCHAHSQPRKHKGYGGANHHYKVLYLSYLSRGLIQSYCEEITTVSGLVREVGPVGFVGLVEPPNRVIQEGTCRAKNVVTQERKRKEKSQSTGEWIRSLFTLIETNEPIHWRESIRSLFTLIENSKPSDDHFLISSRHQQQ